MLEIEMVQLLSAVEETADRYALDVVDVLHCLIDLDGTVRRLAELTQARVQRLADGPPASAVVFQGV